MPFVLEASDKRNEVRMKKSLHISVLSVLASLAVVMLHTNSCFWEFSTERYWGVANLIESVMYFAVPIFFMITGATLIDYPQRYTTKEYFMKRMKKTLIPFVAWNFIGLVYGILRKRITVSSKLLLLFCEMMFNNQIVEIYWFFIPLFSVYMSIPLFAFIPKEKRKSLFTYLAICGFFINSLLPLCATLFGFSYNDNLHLGVVLDYLLYVVIGYLLHEYELSKKFRTVLYLFGMLGLFVHLFGTYYLSMKAGTIVSVFKGYTNVPCVLYAISFFVFMKQSIKRMENSKIIQLIACLDKYTFSVYLMHWFVKDIMIAIFDINIRSMLYRVGAPILIFAICVLITKFVRKTCVGKYLLP